MEIGLKSNYEKPCGKSKRGGIDGDDDESDSNERNINSNRNNLVAFDGFVGGLNGPDISNIE